MILRRFRPAGNGLLFDNSLNYEGLRLDSRMENGYDKGCTRGVLSPFGGRACGFANNRPHSSFYRFIPVCTFLASA